MRQALAERRPRPRSVPSGRAKGAWTWVIPSATIAVCVSGRGQAAAAQAASFWAPRAHAIVCLGAGGGTSSGDSSDLGAVLLDGDPGLRARLRGAAGARGTTAPPLLEARLASLRDIPQTDEARASLAAAGVAAVDGETDVWRAAAARLGVPCLAVRALDEPPPLPPRLVSLVRLGTASWPPARTLLAVLRHPGDRARLRAHDAALTAALLPAARFLAAALA